MSKQTTFIVEILSDQFYNEGSDEIWNVLKELRKLGMNVTITSTVHGSVDNTKLKTCPTPWCKSNTIHTTTFHTQNNGKPAIEVEHSCLSCKVRTPKLPILKARTFWNNRKGTEI